MLALVCLGCRTDPELKVAAPALTAELTRVEFAGCERVLEGPRCEAAPGAELFLWLPHSWQGVGLSLGDRALVARERVVADGYQVRVVVSDVPAQLSVVEPGKAPFRLSLVAAFRTEALTAAQQAKDEGDNLRALTLLTPAKVSASAVERLLAEGIEARVLLRQGRAREASEIWSRTTPALFALGQSSEASRDLFARLYTLIHRLHRVDEAQSWFESFRAAARAYPVGRALEHEHEGMLLASQGRASRALSAYALAERQYERLGQSLDARRVQENRIGLTSDLGQVREALELNTRLLPAPESEHPCGKADLYMKQSWLAFLSVEDGELAHLEVVAQAFREVERWLPACGDPAVQAMHL